MTLDSMFFPTTLRSSFDKVRAAIVVATKMATEKSNNTVHVDAKPLSIRGLILLHLPKNDSLYSLLLTPNRPIVQLWLIP